MTDRKKTLEVILAATPEGEIGYQNTIPWRLKGDLKRFQELTMGHTLIMGRTTYESLPSKLKGRDIVVVSNTLIAQHIKDWKGSITPRPDTVLLELTDSSAVYAATSLLEAVRKAMLLRGTKIFIAGGARLYEEALGQGVDAVHLTLVYKPPESPSYDTRLNLNLLRYKLQGTPESVFWTNPQTHVQEVSHVYCTYSNERND